MKSKFIKFFLEESNKDLQDIIFESSAGISCPKETTTKVAVEAVEFVGS